MGKLKIIAENAAVDGVRELFDARESKKLRIFWIIIWIGCNVFMGIVLWKVLAEYTDEPTVTVVESKIPQSFPMLTVCPITWMNVTKAREIGFDKISHYCKSFIFVFDYFHGYFPNVRVFFETIHNQSAEQFEKFMNANGFQTVKEVVDAVKLQPHDFFIKFPNGSVTTQTAGPSGVCFTLSFINQTGPRRLSQKVVSMHHREIFDQMKTTMPQFERIYIGDYLYSPFGDMPKLQPNESYSVQILARYHQRLPSSKFNCGENLTMHDQWDCMLKCRNEHMVKCVGCTWLNMGLEQTDGHKICHQVDEKTRECYNNDDALEACFKQCAIPCAYWEHTVMTSIFQPESDKVVYDLYIFNPFVSYALIEKESYSWVTLLGNVGGTIGLFNGASVISMFQLFYLCCRNSKNQVNVAVISNKPI